jgi:hypothetical protein
MARLLRKAFSDENDWRDAVSEPCEGPLPVYQKHGRIRFHCTIGAEKRFQSFAFEMTRDDVHACVELLEQEDARSRS